MYASVLAGEHGAEYHGPAIDRPPKPCTGRAHLGRVSHGPMEMDTLRSMTTRSRMERCTYRVMVLLVDEQGEALEAIGHEHAESV